MLLKVLGRTYILYFIYLSIFLAFENVAGDRFSGLCPSGYPRRVVHNRTGYCYVVGSQGPCGRNAVVSADPFIRGYGNCQCKDYGSNCFGRPLIQFGDRCYFEFSQGPCKTKGHWFVRNRNGQAECRKNPCPIIESQRSLLYSEYPENDFYFTMNGSSNKCWKTGTQAFCPTGKRIYFLGSDSYPNCLNYDPYNCNYVPETQEFGQKSQAFVAFGVPYEGI